MTIMDILTDLVKSKKLDANQLNEKNLSRYKWCYLELMAQDKIKFDKEEWTEEKLGG